MSLKTITINLTPRDKEGNTPTFDLNAEGLERYEIIGILEIAIDQIKRDCYKSTKKNTLKKSQS